MKAKNWYKIKEAGFDDELDITVSLVKYGVVENYLVSNFLVSHFAFGPQTGGLDKTDLLDRYNELFESYTRKGMMEFANYNSVSV
jgi:hypothetical protein